MKALPQVHAVDEAAQHVYRECLEALQWSGVPFLVGGAFALESYTGLVRRTKDLDVFVRRDHIEPLLAMLSSAGYRTEMRFTHWLGKAFKDHHFIDIIFGSGNGVCPVDELWFEHAEPATVLGLPVRLIPPEEMLWSKAFIMERERYDGGDIAHLLRARSRTLDWSRVLYRFQGHWRVLFSHVILFGFIYPGHRLTIPKWLMDELMRRLQREMTSLPGDGRLCQGTLLSWSQYLIHMQRGDYEDARHAPGGSLTVQETARMTERMIHEQYGETDSALE
jgi:hypothetical protein